MRYFLRFAYNGKNYHGWQIQPNAISVQEVLEDCMSKLLANKTKVVGAGRTDTGVHAREMYAHFEVEKPLFDQFKQRLNRFLPKDIFVFDVFKVTDDLHARFSATSRTYHYHLQIERSVFTTDSHWQFSRKLDVEKMNAAAKILLEYKDFTSFARLHADTKTNLCDVTGALWEKDSKDTLRFTISANRFLRNMVRAVVGTLVEVGEGKRSLEDFRELIEKKDRNLAGGSAPAHALYLVKVEYPF